MKFILILIKVFIISLAFTSCSEETAENGLFREHKKVDQAQVLFEDDFESYANGTKLDSDVKWEQY